MATNGKLKRNLDMDWFGSTFVGLGWNIDLCGRIIDCYCERMVGFWLHQMSVGLSFLLLLLLVDIDMGEEISSEGWVTSGIVQIVQILSVNR